LPGSRTHHFHRQDLANALRFAQPPQAGRGQNDRIVFSGFELSESGINVPSQGMNDQVWPKGSQLCFAAQAASPNPRALG
jgi:hypothetical protein